MDPSPSAAQRRLLDAARDAFGAKGFHGTTTRDIAAAAGMSPAAVYVHHRTKESLLFAISLGGHEASLRALREAAAAADTPTEQLGAMIRTFVLGHTTDHTLARVVNYELAALAPEHRATIDALRHDIQQLIRGVLADGAATDEFDCADVGMTTNAIMGMCIDVARWYDERDAWAPERIADHSARMALRMAGASSGR
ncbi:TetR family transcriptional regulator [Flexivirga endophytica]|uniref:TetR family transcriptional regulator n=1 Tax=Flexivirga endophytica TaxID=1849103 RepID=A0A916T2F9_9MICO|nr:TetR/AcrR family transcriptional regulator [Flexivirga endophytica]GGB28036.1 TetR family transcriptional regulator [Flexivirga endophytica]GHB61890.1 TetR family transcriptional regulator [Flexivirga endophytica]